MKKNPFKQAGRIKYEYTFDSHGRKQFDSVTIIPPVVFDEYQETREFIINDWESGLLGECVEHCELNEVEWFYNQQQETGKWEIILNFLHKDPAWEYYQRSQRLRKEKLTDE